MEPGRQHAQQYAADAPTTWSSSAAPAGNDAPPSPPAGNDAPPPAGYAPPPAGYAAPSGYGPPAAPRARIGVIVLTALVVELLLIGLGANQWVSDKILGHHTASARLWLIEHSWLSFTWRYSWTGGPTSHWVAQLLLVGCVLLFSAAFIWCLLRGPVTWGRAFVGTWLAVVGATVLGSVVRGLIDPNAKHTLPRTDRVTRALFGAAGPSQLVVVGGLGLGLVVAVVTSIVAVASRRPAAPAPAPALGDPGFAGQAVADPAFADPAFADPAFADPAFADPAFADYAPPAPRAPGALRPWPAQHVGTLPAAPGEQPTTQLPAMPPRSPDDQSAGQPTAQLPSPPPPPPGQPVAASGESETTRFPRPPDDEDLGHIGH